MPHTLLPLHFSLITPLPHYAIATTRHTHIISHYFIITLPLFLLDIIAPLYIAAIFAYYSLIFAIIADA